MKLGLGTAQFGLDYGISNATGRTSLEEVRKIIELASRADVQTIDTAAAYGESEATLGEILGGSQHSFRIVTKLPRLPDISGASEKWISEIVEASLNKLRQNKVYALLMHAPEDLLGERGNEIYATLQGLKVDGMVERIGASVYSGEQIDSLLARYELDLIQLPFNIFDQRLLHSGHLERLSQSGVEIHARSAFLQGLLLMQVENVPTYFDPHREHILSYQSAVEQSGLTALQASLAFVLVQPTISTVICGVNDFLQFEELLSIVSNPPPDSQLKPFASLGSTELGLINPSLWKV